MSDSIADSQELTARYRAVMERIKNATVHHPAIKPAIEPGNGSAKGSANGEPTVQLLAVSKTFPAGHIEALAQLGQRHFGENYVQEACEKIAALKHLREQLCWHLIGPLQSNKTRLVAEQFDWVQSLEKVKTAQRLNDQRPDSMGRLQVCIQVNVSGETSKSGCHPDEVDAIADTILRLPRLQLRGLMAIPEPGAPVSQYRLLSELLAKLRGRYPELAVQLDTLSVGMSDDLEVAVEQGSTMVRIGSAIFGKRGP